MTNDHLTVGDLIEELKEYDEDLPVLHFLDFHPDQYVKEAAKISYEQDAVTQKPHILLR